MATIYLNTPIDNFFGDTDNVIRQMRAVPKGEELEMQVTSGGGSCPLGQVIYQAALEHEGPTSYKAVGLVGSMASCLMAAFDKVKFEESVDIMFHKARFETWDDRPMTADQEYLVNRFNTLSYATLLEKGGDKEFLERVFLGEGDKDHWITAQEAKEYGLGNTYKIERSGGMPKEVTNALAQYGYGKGIDGKRAYYASAGAMKSRRDLHNLNQDKKTNFLDMFKKKKPLRKLTLADGTEACFTGAMEIPVKGDAISFFGDPNKVNGKLRLRNNVELDVKDGEVVDVGEGDGDNAAATDVTREEFDALEARVKALEDSAAGDGGDGNADDAAKDVTDDAKSVTDDGDGKSVTDDGDLKEVKDTLASVVNAVNTMIKATGTDFVPPGALEDEPTQATGNLASLIDAKNAFLNQTKD